MSALVLGDSVVHYEFFGRGRPLIFIHGWLGSWRYWVSSMDALSEDYRVYAFDLWGFGDSDKSRDRYTVENYVDLLHAFVMELGVVTPAPLVGHALGAAVAVSFALEYPALAERIMAVSLPLRDEMLNRRLLAGGSTFLDRVLGRSPTAGYDDVEREAKRAIPFAIQQSIDSVMHFDNQLRLNELHVPLLAVYGEQDPVVYPPDPGMLDGQSGLIRTLTMPECRHFPMLDRSSQFNRLLLDFLITTGDLSSLHLKDEWQRRIR
jgi:pimeloyl-ACP methyl ester carboxylesterase